MSNLIAQRWAVRHVARCTFYDIATDKMLTYLEHLKSSGIEVTSETVYARGGDGNPKIVGFSSDKDVRINLSSAVFDNRAMALLTGNSLKIGSIPIYRREIVTVDDEKAVLPHTPKDEKLLALYTYGADGVEAEELIVDKDYTLNGKELTLIGIDDGTRLVAYYMVDAPDNSQTITVSADVFPGAFKLVMEVLITDIHTKKLYPAQIVIPSCKMEDNWSFSFAPEGDPAPLEMPMEVLKPADSSDMFTMTIYDEDKLV